MQYIPVDSIINEYLAHAGNTTPLDKARLKKYADFLVSKMPYTDKFVHKIKLLEVNSYQIDKPAGFDKLVQLAFCDTTSYTVTRTEIVEWIQKSYDGSGCEVVVSLKCDKCQKVECSCTSPEVVVDVDRIWELNHPEYKYGHLAWYYRHGGLGNDNLPISPFNPKFYLIGPSGDPFMNADMHIKGCLNLNRACQNSPVKYKIDENVIRFTAKTGYVIVSYLSIPVDAEGWRLIPDIPELIEAITWYIDERLSYIEYKASRDETYYRDYNNAMQKKEYFMGMARDRLVSQEFDEFQRDLGTFYGKYLPSQDINGNTVDVFHNVMSRLSLK